MNAFIEYENGMILIYTEWFFPCSVARLKKLKREFFDRCYKPDMRRDFVEALERGIREKRENIIIERGALFESVRDCKIPPAKAKRMHKSIEHRLSRLTKDEEVVQTWREELQA